MSAAMPDKISRFLPVFKAPDFETDFNPLKSLAIGLSTDNLCNFFHLWRPLPISQVLFTGLVLSNVLPRHLPLSSATLRIPEPGKPALTSPFLGRGYPGDAPAHDHFFCRRYPAWKAI